MRGREGKRLSWLWKEQVMGWQEGKLCHLQAEAGWQWRRLRRSGHRYNRRELRLGKINLLAVGKMRESERLWAEIPRRELEEVPLGRSEGLSRRGGMRRWARCFDKPGQREGTRGKGWERRRPRYCSPTTSPVKTTGTPHSRLLPDCKVLTLMGLSGQ